MKARLIIVYLVMAFVFIAPFFMLGCANQPIFCPEVKVTFCPVK